MTTEAVVPAYTPVGEPVTAMVTGKVEVPPLVVPTIGWVAPLGVIDACSPFFSLARSEAPTVASTTHEFVAMTTTCADEADEAEVLPDPVEPVPPDPPPVEPEPPVVPLDEPEV